MTPDVKNLRPFLDESLITADITNYRNIPPIFRPIISALKLTTIYTEYGRQYWFNMVNGSRLIEDQLSPGLTEDFDFEKFWRDVHTVAAFKYSGSVQQGSEGADDIDIDRYAESAPVQGVRSDYRKLFTTFSSPQITEKVLKELDPAYIDNLDQLTKIILYDIHVATISNNFGQKRDNNLTLYCLEIPSEERKEVLKRIWGKIFSLINPKSSATIVPDVKMDIIADIFREMTVLHLFLVVNNSIIMLLVNYLLKVSGFRPVPHALPKWGRLDYLAAFSSETTFRRILKEFVATQEQD
jgi:hypothetical protein